MEGSTLLTPAATGRVRTDRVALRRMTNFPSMLEVEQLRLLIGTIFFDK